MAADIFTKFYPQDKRETWKAMARLVGVYAGNTWEEDLGNEGGGHQIALERQMGKTRIKTPTIACTTVIDEEQYVDSVNLFFDDGMPPTNKNYMETIEKGNATDYVLNGTCLNMVSENPNNVADTANQHVPQSRR